jgi:type IV pilus assembly protein PilE
MRKFPTTRVTTAAGFTLIELMIVVAVATILAMIAIPSYQSQIRKSRRTEVKTALLDLAAREERYMSTNSAYSAAAADLGYTGFPVTLASGFYSIDAPVVTIATATVPASFTLTANVAGVQVADTQCAKFMLTNTGLQTATTATCWN